VRLDLCKPEILGKLGEKRFRIIHDENFSAQGIVPDPKLEQRLLEE
jgi:hypothetical protein